MTHRSDTRKRRQPLLDEALQAAAALTRALVLARDHGRLEHEHSCARRPRGLTAREAARLERARCSCWVANTQAREWLSRAGRFLGPTRAAPPLCEHGQRNDEQCIACGRG